MELFIPAMAVLKHFGQLYLASSCQLISAWRPTILTGFFRSFPQPLQANAGIALKLGHDRFLPNPFQFTLSFDAYNLSY
jgi:hypothetical protein